MGRGATVPPRQSTRTSNAQIQTGHRQGGGGRGGGGGSGNGGGGVTGAGTSQAGNISEPCGMCGQATSAGAIGCDSCPLWYHPTTSCTGLQPATLQCIRDEGGDAVRFVCGSCRCSPQASADSTGSPDALSQLYSMVKALTMSVAELTKQVSSLTTQMQAGPQQHGQGSAPQSILRDEVREEVRELEEQRKRKDSLFIRGISAQNDVEFTNKFKSVCQAVTGQPLAPDSVFCIDRVKMLYRVKVTNVEHRTNILNTAKNLKDHSSWSTVFINRDLTYKQRQQRRLRVGAAQSDASPGNSAGSQQGSNRGPVTGRMAVDPPAPITAGGSNFH